VAVAGADASRGDVWIADLDPTRGHEQAGRRPAVVVSVDLFNHGPAGLVIIVPLTSRDRRIPTRVEVNPPEGGLTRASFAKCEDIRSVSTERLCRRVGRVTTETLAEIEDRLCILLGL